MQMSVPANSSESILPKHYFVAEALPVLYRYYTGIYHHMLLYLYVTYQILDRDLAFREDCQRGGRVTAEFLNILGVLR